MKTAELEQAIIQLSGDPRFQLFIEQIEEQKNMALAEAVANDNIGDGRVVSGYLGEIRAYLDIIAVYKDAQRKRMTALGQDEDIS
jgi:ClpP class serine protease